MKKVFWDNPYQTELTTKVASIENDKILFEETIAYSFAGGQESDKAWVNEIPILNSVHEGNLIYYFLPEDHGLKVGDTVTMKIDWPRRHKLMRLHFAAELILEIVTQKYNLEKVGAHISETKSRIDFKSDANISQYFDEILEAYSDIINKNLVIEKDYSDIATQRRYWKIDGFAQVPCGGTHVDRTSEVGFVKLKRDRPGKSIERIEIRLYD
ncbi:alanyl-tRNA editing protein [candidate division TM6 bacterium RIFCSPHIGHO2_12_FULL_32_22]|nr:MAG: alanyl-tRNA editing protein [candidate division TM6 bacterium RIFCSPHIGHO2_12_FULL_32_22]